MNRLTYHWQCYLWMFRSTKNHHNQVTQVVLAVLQSIDWGKHLAGGNTMVHGGMFDSRGQGYMVIYHGISWVFSSASWDVEQLEFQLADGRVSYQTTPSRKPSFPCRPSLNQPGFMGVESLQ